MTQPTVNAQRVAAFRAKKRSEMGTAAYKAEEARKRKERRQRKARQAAEPSQSQNSRSTENLATEDHKRQLQELIKTLQEEVARPRRTLPEVRALIQEQSSPSRVKNVREADDCDDLLKMVISAKLKHAAANKKTITKSSIKTQFNRVQNIYKKIYNKKMNCADFEWVRDTKKIIDFIHSGKTWKTPASQNSQFSALASILSVLSGYEKEYNIYSDVSTDKAKQIKKDAEEIRLTDKEKAIILPWSEIKNVYTKKRTGDRADQHKAIAAITILMPPRRNEDYRLLTITDGTDDMTDDKNYILVKDGIPLKLIYNKYKTAKTFGKQEFDIPEKLADQLATYIKKDKLKNGNPLFGTQKKNYYKNFTTQIQDAYQSLAGKPLTINLLRHAYITDFLSTKRTPAQRRKLANQMAHSVEQQNLYDRIDI